ncbi:LPP20 family lipoprotein [Shewanella yunxiaonensis]|uniref:LPP20 family lipoprotein n=1 Tax=Shewanella yunxiaonensis TaxID=2829809 RepID=A0ABX7YW54_9GAMM|nr:MULTISPECIES: LPP20 family lipoprotein [Shewanella]MDF0534766.1 LPP20 family lipoprotein [Shewanella sp. A32]QUN06311.1 LPP20 family lipoprotein [Shewanella yunxiaonensis]
MRKLLMLITVLLLSGCTHEQLVRYELVAPNNAQVLQATGYAPIASQTGPSYEEKLMQAMEASRLDAYRRLAEQLYGQQLRAYTRMTGETTSRKTMDAKVQGVVRGAKVVNQSVQGEFYTTELSLDTKVLADLGSVENKPVETENKWWY